MILENFLQMNRLNLSSINEKLAVVEKELGAEIATSLTHNWNKKKVNITLDYLYDYFDGGINENQEARCIIWTPKNSKDEKTLFLSNFKDGWQTLIHYYQKKYQKELTRFSLCDLQVKYPMFTFEFTTPTQSRLIQLIKNGPKWEFYQRGDALSFENPDVYKKRSLSDRLSNEVIHLYLLHLGINIIEMNFWESDMPAIEFTTIYQPT